jgi:lipoprotein-releasing system permease protein
MKRFQVEGAFTTGVYEYDGSLVFMHIADAQRLFRMGEAVTGITIQVDDAYQARETADKIIALLGSSYWAKDWMQRNQNLFSALKLEKIAMFAILALIILVAAFNIAGTLIMMVMEKTRDIAVLMAMGSTRKSIRRIFIIKGMIIGLIGVALGTGLGATLCVLLRHYRFIELPDDVYYITTLPVQLGLFDVSAIAVSAMAICFLATLYPAHQAAKLNPIEALRYG